MKIRSLRPFMKVLIPAEVVRLPENVERIAVLSRANVEDDEVQVQLPGRQFPTIFRLRDVRRWVDREEVHIIHLTGRE